MDRHTPSDYGLDHLPDQRRRPEPIAPASQSVDPTPLPTATRPDPLQEIALLRDRSAPRVVNRGSGTPKSSGSEAMAVTRTERPPNTQPRARSRGHEERRPRRPARASHPVREIGLPLRPEERTLMQELAKFRVIAVRDAADLLYQGSGSGLRADAEYLREQGLVAIHNLNTRRDGRDGRAERLEVLTLTRRGRNVVRKSGELPSDQRIYSGLVKPREAEHDTQIFRAYHKELDRIEREGGRNVRVRLDFEIKAAVNRAVYLARKADPDRDGEGVKAEIAETMTLRTERGSVVVPDLRIEYDLPGGGSTHVDVEVATAAYRHAQIASKARAGMRIYASQGDIGRLGAAIQDDHDIMSEILSL